MEQSANKRLRAASELVPYTKSFLGLWVVKKMTQNTHQAASIPDEALQLEKDFPLGTPIAAFKAHYSRADLLFFTSQIVTLLFTLIALVAIVIADTIYHIQGIIWVFFILVAFNSYTIININRRKNKALTGASPFERNNRIYIYKDGFIYMHRQRCLVVSWQQVRQVQYASPDITPGRIAVLSVVYEDERRVRRVKISTGNAFTAEDIASLATLVKQQTYL